jgi:hypothetical protein
MFQKSTSEVGILSGSNPGRQSHGVTVAGAGPSGAGGSVQQERAGGTGATDTNTSTSTRQDKAGSSTHNVLVGPNLIIVKCSGLNADNTGADNTDANTDANNTDVKCRHRTRQGRPKRQHT